MKTEGIRNVEDHFSVPASKKGIIGDWENFIKFGTKPSSVDIAVHKSWKRCMDCNVDPIHGGKSQIVLSSGELKDKLSKYSDYINITRFYMQKIYNAIKGYGYLLYLTDNEANIIYLVGDDKTKEEFRQIFNFCAGAAWSEDAVGTTAVAIALSEHISVPYISDSKYCLSLKATSCSGIPLRDENNNVFGILGAAANFKNMAPQIFWMLVSAQFGIENQIRMKQQREVIRMHSNYYKSVFNSVSDAIIGVDSHGVIKEINATAETIINESANKIIGRNVKDVLEFHPLLYTTGNQAHNKSTHGDHLIDTKDGTFKYMFQKKIRRLGENGKPDGILHIIKKKKFSQVKGGSDNKQIRALYCFEDLIGKSPVFTKCKELARRAAKADSNILLTGETGTGKDLFAQAIHKESSRCNQAFIAINCGAIPKDLIESELFGYAGGSFTGADKKGRPGKFELADGGTIFLDEIGEMPKDLQVRLLRVLQDGEVVRIGGMEPVRTDVRVIAATNKDIVHQVNTGNFRSDLYWRLNVINIDIPPLIQRNGDIFLLADYFISKHNLTPQAGSHTLDKEVSRIFSKYNWPGNVRELENVIERALVFTNSNIIEKGDLPDHMQKISTSPRKHSHDGPLAKSEKSQIIEVLNKSNFNISLSAKVLRISRNTLYNKIKKYKIDGLVRSRHSGENRSPEPS